MLELRSHALRLLVRPEIGGAVAQLDWLGGAQPVPVFRPWDGHGDDPNQHACYPLVPWSNRLSGGGFEAGARFWPIAANLPGEPYPIHGDGWQRRWSVTEQAPALVRLTLESSEQPPYHYRGELTYEIAGSVLIMRLAIEHRGTVTTPYGLGFHPWLPRTPGTTLQAPARTVWLETEDHLSAGAVTVAERPDWDFAAERALPLAWINNGFTGWDGRAAIRWFDRDLALAITADPMLSTYILYSPGADAAFFCFEAVSHPVDAFHWAGSPGLHWLGPGERLAASCRFTVAERAACDDAA
jgi:aldose 1-epimerase